MMDLQWYDWIGLVGALMVLAAHFLLQAGRLHGNGLPYQSLNLLGAAAVLASLYGRFDVSTLLLTASWMAITAYGILRTSKGMGAAKTPG